MAKQMMETKRFATRMVAENEGSPLFRYRQVSSGVSEGTSSSSDIVGLQKVSSSDEQKERHDTSITRANVPTSLPLKLAGDAAIGVGVTFLMAPFLSVVDKAISQRAAGSHTLMSSCLASMRSMMSNPVAFARNPVFLWSWAVYGATYTTANSLKTIVEHRKEFSPSRSKATSPSDSNLDQESVGKLGIFLGTSFANSGASVLKDRAFAYMFAADAATAATQKVPVASYGLWLSRDLIGVGSSFVLPDLIAKRLSDPSNPEEQQKYRDLSQFGVPVATQFVAGPLHLMGLDLFNRPMQSMSWRDALAERTKFLASGYSAVVGARIARIIPGYGFGGVLNTKFRDNWREYLLERDASGEPMFHNFELSSRERASRLFMAIQNIQSNVIEIA